MLKTAFLTKDELIFGRDHPEMEAGEMRGRRRPGQPLDLRRQRGVRPLGVPSPSMPGLSVCCPTCTSMYVRQNRLICPIFLFGASI